MQKLSGFLHQIFPFMQHVTKIMLFLLCFVVPCPEMILVPKPIKVRPDKTVTFSCVAWSYGGLVYKWSRNDSLSLPYNSTIFYEDKPLPVNSINTTMYEIKIFNIQETDEGQYCCVASNDCGSTTKCAWLEVNSKFRQLLVHYVCMHIYFL